MKQEEEFDAGAYYSAMYYSSLLPNLGDVMATTRSSDPVERRRAIKQVIDGSLALTAVGAKWSSALVQEFFSSGSSPQASLGIGKKSRTAFRRRRVDKIVRARVEALKGLIPGGKQMDSLLVLMQEALDYSMFLELQVQVLQSLIQATST